MKQFILEILVILNFVNGAQMRNEKTALLVTESGKEREGICEMLEKKFSVVDCDSLIKARNIITSKVIHTLVISSSLFKADGFYFYMDLIKVNSKVKCIVLEDIEGSTPSVVSLPVFVGKNNLAKIIQNAE